MTTETKPRMSVAEVALMREIVWWRKNHGIDYSHVHGCWREPRVFDAVAPSRVGRAVTADLSVGEIGVSEGGTWSHEYRWHKVESLTQAVDLLVALGFLPQRFSSAYRAGWDAATMWSEGDPQAPQFKAMFHDPANIGFPAHEVTW